ncbi:DUF4157 domain-containing protein [Mycobacterium sp.]|uniref:eCIS core domain-containing protein n=1 Tax=Mycobacterium sp. TaxID=1785 RepID=UPI002BF30FA3|nr:DUF4157 domain-containing protein [Mycobacterium sp.]HKP41172.1 DUF4157 domain-containing protein [Mycobacterium sp.]
MLSEPGEPAERRASVRAADVQAHVSRPPEAYVAHLADTAPQHRSPYLPAGTPTAIAARAGHGRPLGAEQAARLGPALDTDLGHVRIHTDDPAAQLAHEARAHAFTIGSHIFFGGGEYRPDTAAGARLLHHELAHVAEAAPGPARVFRDAVVELGEPTIVGQDAPDAATKPEDLPWERLQVEAIGMDDAAKVLAGFAGTKTPWVYVGLHPKFVKVYGTSGEALGPRVPMKSDAKITFYPGVYELAADGSLAALQVRGDDYAHIRHETDAEGKERSVIGQRELTAAEQKKALEERQKSADQSDPKSAAAAPAKAAKLENFDVMSMLSAPEQVRDMVAKVPGAHVIYFVPKYQVKSGGGRGNGTVPSVYSSPIEGRADGQPPNAPPWPVTVEGPKLVTVDSDPSFTAKVQWSANGNYSVTSQVIAQVGSDIRYRWELFDITEYAKAQLKKDPSHAAADSTAAPEKTLDERIDEFTHANAGAGTDVTGMGGANREFSREFEDWWKDTERANKRLGASGGATAAERFNSDMANLTSIELAPVSLLVTALSASLKWLAELFGPPTEQQQVPLKEKGIFLIRTIATPAVGEDLKGQPVIRPPAVAGHVVEVADTATALNEALDEPAAQIAELQAQIDLARKEGNQSRVEYLESLMLKAKLNLTGSPLDVLVARRKAKNDELEKFRKDYPSLSDYSMEHDVETLDRLISLYNRYEDQRTAGATTDLPPAVRVNAALISEVSGQQYPLLLAAGPMPKDGDDYRWLINDVTNLDGAGAYEGRGATPSKAFQAALDKFGGKASYGRGSIAVRTAGLGLEADAPATLRAESAPVDWAVAEKRIDDLVTVLAAIGLIVASAGTAAALIGAAAAAARLIQRWEAGKLYLDASTVSDLLGLLGGMGAAGQLVSGFRVAKFGRAFTILEEAGATEAQLAEAAKAVEGAESLVKGAEMANKIIGGAGVVWGDVSFIDQMMSISEQEESGSMTHAEARRARAAAVSSAVQNNGMFIAGEAIGARAKARANDAAAAKGGSPAPEAAKAGGEPGTATTQHEGRATAAPERGGAAIDIKPPSSESDPSAGHEAPAPAEPKKTTGADETDKSDTKPTDPAARTVPIGERRATAQELREALPPDLRDVMIIDDTLEGDHVRAEWDPDPDTGLVTNIRLRVSPDALPTTVRLHTDTLRTMQKYQGLSGRVRLALNWIAEMIGVQTLDPGNKPLFDAQLEVKKLPKLIAEHMKAMEAMEPNARTEAEAKLDSLEQQLAEHLAALSIGELTPSSGVAQRDVAPRNRKKYNELLVELRKHKPGSDEHRRIRREMYELSGGEKLYDAWLAIYESNVGKANKANEIVEAERVRLDWPESEKTIDLPGGEVRRIDLFNPPKEGAEVKAYEGGTVYASKEILDEVAADRHLVKRRGWSMTWMFIGCEPSGPLLDALGKAGITVELRTGTTTSSRIKQRIPPPVAR